MHQVIQHFSCSGTVRVAVLSALPPACGPSRQRQALRVQFRQLCAPCETWTTNPKPQTLNPKPHIQATSPAPSSPKSSSATSFSFRCSAWCPRWQCVISCVCALMFARHVCVHWCLHFMCVCIDVCVHWFVCVIYSTVVWHLMCVCIDVCTSLHQGRTWQWCVDYQWLKYCDTLCIMMYSYHIEILWHFTHNDVFLPHWNIVTLYA